MHVITDLNFNNWTSETCETFSGVYENASFLVHHPNMSAMTRFHVLIFIWFL